MGNLISFTAARARHRNSQMDTPTLEAMIAAWRVEWRKAIEDFFTKPAEQGSAAK